MNAVCSHCEKSVTLISVRGKRLVNLNNSERLVAYCLCNQCNSHLRSANYKAYNNVANTEMEKLKADFWHKVDVNLKKSLL